MMVVNRQNTNATNFKKHLMKKIKEYDFAIVETTLFLDTHPNNMNALSYYSKLRNEREKLCVEFEEKFGPITMYGNMSDKKWSWVDRPWPWEGEC